MPLAEDKVTNRSWISLALSLSQLCVEQDSARLSLKHAGRPIAERGVVEGCMDAVSSLASDGGRCSGVCSSLKPLTACLEIGNLAEGRSKKQKPQALLMKRFGLDLDGGQCQCESVSS